MKSTQNLLSAALSAASAATDSLLADYKRNRASGGRALRSWSKSHGALVTEADMAADDAIAESLRVSGSEVTRISEESSSGDLQADEAWLIDPLCGTVPFRSGMPHWGVNIAYRNGGDLVTGVITVPALGDTIAAASGGGALLNGEAYTGRDPQLPVDEAIVGLEIDGLDEWRRLLEPTSNGSTQVAWAGTVGHTNTFCSAAYPLYLVCTGGMSGVIFYRIDAVHLAAGALIAQELGALVTDGRGDQIDWRSGATIPVAVVAWPSVHGHLINAISAY